jgi:hypothetical protein
MHPRVRPRRPLHIDLFVTLGVFGGYSAGFDECFEDVAFDGFDVCLVGLTVG